jgi:tetratricopeptide (TPR) repeat protein
MRILFFLSMVIFCPLFAWATTGEEYYSAGMSLFRQQDYPKAIQYFHAALEEKPDLWEAYQFMGEAYYQSGNRTEAVVAMRQSLKLHSDNPELHKFLSRVEDNSPWVPSHSIQAILPILSLVISLGTLGWTFYWIRRYGRRGSNYTPPKA